MRRNDMLRLLSCLLLVGACGCTSVQHNQQVASPTSLVEPQTNIPRELRKTVLPPYVIEPPDILVIDAVHINPKPPYYLRTADVLAIAVDGTLPDYPIDKEAYLIEPGGVVNLGIPYGNVKISGLSVDDAREKIIAHLKNFLRDPEVNVSLLQMAGMQQIAGEHVVGPDGTVNLGTYGMVNVVGLTVQQARQVIEKHLSQHLEDPQVAVQVFSYNSKFYYVITEGAGLGDSVAAFPITGNETVLDAIARIQGLQSVSSSKIWIARPSPYCNDYQLLPVDWKATVSCADTSTNYQLLPGDRLFIAEDKFVAWDNKLGKFLAPFERMFGFSLLGVQTVGRFSGNVLQNANLNGGGFGGGF